ncbi:antichymotrypsin-2-like [Bacillus rossius redtenbacheri]|uniref:antichymotrypsin-2-like n=1 Tax=Bacillus rossius redtenbacheri TaxID=93214 RepID=UPI002FDEEC42
MVLLASFLVLVSLSFTAQSHVAVNEELRTVADASNSFTMKFAQYLKKTSPSSNAVFSPVSAYSVLAGLTEGADGNTRAQLLSALGLPDDDSVIRGGYRGIATAYEASKNGKVILNMADAFFLSKYFEPKASFMTTMRSDFKCDVKKLDFTSGDSAVSEINNWVSTETDGRISQLYEPGELRESTLLVLANAVYFKGAWKYSFETGATSQRTFHLNSNDSIAVDTMSVESQFLVYSDDSVQANVLELPYTGEEMKMMIILPYQIDGLEQTIQNLKNIPKQGRYDYASDYIIYVPKFEITSSSMDIGEILKSLGVEDAFSQEANFSRIASQQVVLDSVKQKAFVAVSEEGTEAAAATGGGEFPGPSIGSRPGTFEVDHPFVYLIVHVPTDTVIFAGYVLTP